MQTEILIVGEKNDTVLDYLLRRRSTPIKNLAEPGPDKTQIETILRAATRVADHGRMAPWHFIVFTGEARTQAGKLLQDAWKVQEPEAAPERLVLEANRFLRAPVVIAVVCRFREGKIPLWEQMLSTGAACQNLILAANALGFGSNWVTEWPTFSAAFRESLGLDARDNIAGFIYLGTPSEMPAERERPDLSQITTWWAPGAKLNKGETFGQPGAGLPDARISLPTN